MDPTVLNGIVVGIPTLAGMGFTAWKFRKVQKSTDANASYDQIQEDLLAMRTERATDRAAAIAEREKDRAEMQHLQDLVRHLDNEVVQLRYDIQVGTVPPLKPREPFPRRAAS